MKPSYWIAHLSLLALGVSLGVALIYFVQPPKPPTSFLNHELFLFTSDKPVKDFTPHFQALAYNASQGVVMSQGGDLVANIQFASTPGMLTKFNMVLPNQSSTLTGMQFETCGDLVGNRLHTSLKIGVDNTEVTHFLNLGEREYRVIELITGTKDHRRWCYAIIKIVRAKPAPTFPSPAPTPPTATKAT